MTYAIIAAIVLVLGCVAAYYTARFMKGKLQLELSQDTANSEELLTGRVTLQAKKPIQGALRVSLVGREKRTKRGVRRNNSNDTEWVEVYRYDNTLEPTRDFEAGFEQVYIFDLLAPTKSEVDSAAGLLKGIAEAAGEGAMGGMLKMAAGAASFLGGRIHWHIEARLDAKGVDLYAKHKCQVNLNG